MGKLIYMAHTLAFMADNGTPVEALNALVAKGQIREYGEGGRYVVFENQEETK